MIRACSWIACLVFLTACEEQHEPRAAPIVARRVGGDSIAPGAMVRICGPEDEACVATYPVACSMIWMGDSAEKPFIPPLSPEEQAWCDAHGGNDSRSH